MATFTIDRLAFSMSPPVVAVVIDFDGGGRFQCEMTDCAPSDIGIGTAVEHDLPPDEHGTGNSQLLLESNAPPGLRRSITMASNGICDRVAIVGMGCTPFGEHWGKGVDDLLIDSSQEALRSAGVTIDDIDAFWLGTMGSGQSGLTLSRPLKIDYKPVTRLENFCATGSESFRNAATQSRPARSTWSWRSASRS